MKPLLLACLCLALLHAPTSALAQSPAATTAAPSTEAAPAQDDPGRALVAAINDAAPESLPGFVASRFSARALASRPANAWLALLRKLGGPAHPLTVAGREGESPTILALRVHTPDEHWAKLVVFLDRKQPDKIANIFVLPIMSPADEEKTRFPSARMSEAEVIKTIDRQIAARAALDRFSGTVLVAKGDRILLTRAVGMADKSFRVPNDADTRFHLGSMDKMFTGVAIAQLVQAERLSFDDTLAKVLPDFPDQAMASKITIHQLLTHTAGTGDYIARDAYRQNRNGYRELADYIPLIAGQPLAFEPGARFSYSNSGYLLLGLVIEKISGENYFDYVARHVFGPAGMKDTGPFELDAVVPNRATGYLRDAEEDPLGLGPYRSNVFFLGNKGTSAGGSYSNLKDLFAFARALRTGKLLDKAMVDTVLAGKVKMVGAGEQGDYGYGFTTRVAGGKTLRGMGGGGVNSGVNSELEMFDDGSYTVIVLGNYDAPAAQDLNTAICEFLAHQ